MKYSFEFKIQKTQCQKSVTSLSSCSGDNDAKLMVCQGSLLDKIWMKNRYSNVTFTCKNE